MNVFTLNSLAGACNLVCGLHACTRTYVCTCFFKGDVAFTPDALYGNADHNYETVILALGSYIKKKNHPRTVVDHYPI